jgi:hypothetical protein
MVDACDDDGEWNTAVIVTIPRGASDVRVAIEAA